MNITISPRKLHGNVQVIPSKSQAHRLLITAAFADRPTRILCREVSRDMEATALCLNGMGAKITREPEGYLVVPISCIPAKAVLNCKDSGSTLRFLLPVAAALGVDTTFHLEGRLPERPLSPLWEELQRMGCILERPTANTIRCHGQLQSGEFTIAGNISSQFVTGLLFAAALLPGSSKIRITGELESKPYVDMTRQVLADFGIQTDNFCIPGGQVFHSPGTLEVEGDWSNGAFFLAANTLGSQLRIRGLSSDSAQGDKAVTSLLEQLHHPCRISCENIPDLVPILAIAAAARSGAVFQNIARLRLKESDRVAAIEAMLRSLGGASESDENTLRVFPTGFTGGTVDACRDHRIAMAAAIAATVCREPVTILGAECVEKSYPDFWNIYRKLGGGI